MTGPWDETKKSFVDKYFDFEEDFYNVPYLLQNVLHRTFGVVHRILSFVRTVGSKVLQSFVLSPILIHLYLGFT